MKPIEESFEGASRTWRRIQSRSLENVQARCALLEKHGLAHLEVRGDETLDAVARRLLWRVVAADCLLDLAAVDFLPGGVSRWTLKEAARTRRMLSALAGPEAAEVFGRLIAFETIALAEELLAAQRRLERYALENLETGPVN